jgi:hypothetical protein
MNTEHPAEVEHTHETRVTSSRTWSPAQIIAGIIGLFLTVMGGVAMARLLPTSSLTAETTTVMGVGHTVLMAIITLGLGLLYLAEAGTPFEIQPGMIFLGVASLAFGLIVIIEPAAFDGALGLGETGGWFYTIIGAISVIAGIISPTLVSRRR